MHLTSSCSRQTSALPVRPDPLGRYILSVATGASISSRPLPVHSRRCSRLRTPAHLLMSLSLSSLQPLSPMRIIMKKDQCLSPYLPPVVDPGPFTSKTTHHQHEQLPQPRQHPSKIVAMPASQHQTAPRPASVPDMLLSSPPRSPGPGAPSETGPAAGPAGPAIDCAAASSDEEGPGFGYTMAGVGAVGCASMVAPVGSCMLAYLLWFRG